MIIWKWDHCLLEWLTSVAHIQSHHTVAVSPLGKNVAANQQEAVVISEIPVKFTGSSSIRVVRGEEVERSV